MQNASDPANSAADTTLPGPMIPTTSWPASGLRGSRLHLPPARETRLSVLSDPDLDSHVDRRTFLDDVLGSLSRMPKTLPCKYFYDRRGSELFDAICQLPEYYLTRTELAILKNNAHRIADCIGPNAMVVEFGSGSSTKTRILLDALRSPAAYVPVDISHEHLLSTAQSLRDSYGGLTVMPVSADFTTDFRLPRLARPASRVVVYFPGSTIGNFNRETSLVLLRNIRTLGGAGGGLIVGIDLRKDTATLEAAYNDAQGVTAAFNRNILVRMNRELGAGFDIDAFQHQACFNRAESRIEMYLVSQRNQTVTFPGRQIRFHAGERVHTENSHKYTVEDFSGLAAQAGLRFRYGWSDPNRLFAVLYFGGGDDVVSLGRVEPHDAAI